MKNACISVRNISASYDGSAVGTVVTALTAGGYTADKIFLLDDADEREFAQTVIECKNFFENVFLVVPPQRVTAYTAQAAGLLKCEPMQVMESGQKSFFVIPYGEEGRRAVLAEVLPYFEKKYSRRRACSVLRFVGAPRERVDSLIAEAKQGGEGAFEFFYSEKFGDGRLEIGYDAQTPSDTADAVLRLLVEGLKEYLYALDDTPLHMQVVELLKLRGKKLCAAESFTGGGVTKRIVDVPGASEILYEGVVAYANEAKMRRLGVRGETLRTQGAVSDETAYEMAAGLIASGCCTVSVATTGIAGPASDNTNKPVGLCYLAVGTAESVYVYKYIFEGSREEVTERAINQTLFLLYKKIR